VIDHYTWSGGREAMLRFGPADGPAVVVALPLFEEANRTRTFVVGMLRRLASHGIGSVLPDLPGTGESVRATVEASLSDWRAAYDAVIRTVGDRPAYAVAIRGGALIDSLAAVAGRWHFAPASGHDLVRELLRTKKAEMRESGLSRDSIDLPDDGGTPVEVAGNLLPRSLLAELEGALPRSGSGVRSVRLETDPRPADLKVAGAPLWRRSEPGDDPALAAILADDIAAWVRACEG